MFKSARPYATKRPVTAYYVAEETPEEAAARVAAEAAAEAKVQARIQAAVDEQVTGLKKKNDELIGKNKALGEQSKLFEGLDPVALKALKERLDNDDDAKLLAEGKKNLVIEKYTERMRAQHLQDLKIKDDLIKAEAARADTYKGAVLDNQIRRVLQGLHPGAVEDALLHARSIFSLDAKGVAVKLDSEGRPELGKDGSSPFSPAEWIEVQKETKQHWFPNASSGSGAGNSGQGGSGAGKTISRANFDKMSPAEQAVTARSGTKIVD